MKRGGTTCKRDMLGTVTYPPMMSTDPPDKAGIPAPQRKKYPPDTAHSPRHRQTSFRRGKGYKRLSYRAQMSFRHNKGHKWNRREHGHEGMEYRWWRRGKTSVRRDIGHSEWKRCWRRRYPRYKADRLYSQGSWRSAQRNRGDTSVCLTMGRSRLRRDTSLTTASARRKED